MATSSIRKLTVHGNIMHKKIHYLWQHHA